MQDGSSTEISTPPAYKKKDQGFDKYAQPKGLGWARRVALAAVAAVTSVAAQPALQPAPQDASTGYTPNQPGQTEAPRETAPEQSFWQNNTWVNEIRQKLNGEGLDGSEEFLEDMRVISLGEPGVIGPNLREYPASFVPPGVGNFNGTEVPILGILLPGGTIDRGITALGTVRDQNGNLRNVEFVAFKLGDYHGSIVNDQREPVGLNPAEDPNRIVVAAKTYLQPQTQAR